MVHWPLLLLLCLQLSSEIGVKEVGMLFIKNKFLFHANVQAFHLNTPIFYRYQQLYRNDDYLIFNKTNLAYRR